VGAADPGAERPHLCARVHRARRRGLQRGRVRLAGQPARPLAGPRHLATYARNHRSIKNCEHYVRDKTFAEDLQRVRTGNQPIAYTAIRNLAIGASRRVGFASIAHARRCYVRDDQRILALYGYA
jgi:hypothetical protein